MAFVARSTAVQRTPSQQPYFTGPRTVLIIWSSSEQCFNFLLRYSDQTFTSLSEVEGKASDVLETWRANKDGQTLQMKVMSPWQRFLGYYCGLSAELNAQKSTVDKRTELHDTSWHYARWIQLIGGIDNIISALQRLRDSQDFVPNISSADDSVPKRSSADLARLALRITDEFRDTLEKWLELADAEKRRFSKWQYAFNPPTATLYSHRLGAIPYTLVDVPLKPQLNGSDLSHTMPKSDSQYTKITNSKMAKQPHPQKVGDLEAKQLHPQKVGDLNNNRYAPLASKK